MNDNFCCCGAQAGYPHRPDCPRPCYNASDSQFEKWEQEWLYLQRDKALPVEQPECDNCGAPITRAGLCPTCAECAQEVEVVTLVGELIEPEDLR